MHIVEETTRCHAFQLTLPASPFSFAPCEAAHDLHLDLVTVSRTSGRLPLLANLRYTYFCFARRQKENHHEAAANVFIRPHVCTLDA